MDQTQSATIRMTSRGRWNNKTDKKKKTLLEKQKENQAEKCNQTNGTPILKKERSAILQLERKCLT